MAGPRWNPGTLFPLWRPLRKFLSGRMDVLRRIHSRRRDAEVFPWMEHSMAASAIVGAIAAYYLGRAHDLGVRSLILGAMAGTLVGIWMALSWAASRPGDAPGRDLWDLWIDETREIVTEDVVAFDGEATPERARVRPRVESSEGGESLPLEDEVGMIFARHDRGAVRISGPDGSGKTTALSHLASLLPPHLQVSFLDGPDPLSVCEAESRGRVVFASNEPGPKPLAHLKLASWGEDEWIEYLLAGDGSRCALVMARLTQVGAERDLLDGIPELWSIVLDHMAADESIAGPRQALWNEFDRRFPDRDFRKLIEGDCLDALTMRGESTSRRVLRRHEPDEAVFRMIRHRPIQLMLAAGGIADDLSLGRDCPALASPLPLEIVRETALRIAGRPEASDHLRRLVYGRDEAFHPMSASLLHALGMGWKPDKPPPCLKGAYLEEASWAGLILVEADLRGADLGRADLWGARLDRARLDNARLGSADLRNASLGKGQFRHADLRRARLAKAHAESANFESAQLGSADLDGSFLDRAIFRDADLGDASLQVASLVGADLTRAKVEGANFSGADLSGAVLCNMKLAGARFDGARFQGANLSRSDLEELTFLNADFENATFDHALLTGSRMPAANFRGARLFSAGLAEVEWEGADLRGADLRQAAFHLGSSRSGLVGSPTPCEGSRTGFYTDDYNDQDFKSPEEIRKANLRGADLRGAKLIGVDFYLVDLRHAKLDPEQVEHLRRCGAILESRV